MYYYYVPCSTHYSSDAKRCQGVGKVTNENCFPTSSRKRSTWTHWTSRSIEPPCEWIGSTKFSTKARSISSIWSLNLVQTTTWIGGSWTTTPTSIANMGFL